MGDPSRRSRRVRAADAHFDIARDGGYASVAVRLARWRIGRFRVEIGPRYQIRTSAIPRPASKARDCGMGLPAKNNPGTTA